MMYNHYRGGFVKVLITGASSGIGKSFAKKFSEMGYDVILVARNKRKLDKVKKELSGSVEVVALDISSTFNCMKLYNKVKKDNIDILINNAGVGLFGAFADSKIDTELDMIDLNIKAVHTLTKLFLKDFKEKDSGYILNVASIASYMPGPLMAAYYATKAYILSLTTAINEELKIDKSNVYIGALCPGPVKTNFQTTANVKFNLKEMSPEEVVNYAVDKMFDGKRTIIPGLRNKIIVNLSKLSPLSLKLKMVLKSQESNKNE